jgi:hypothetical protein
MAVLAADVVEGQSPMRIWNASMTNHELQSSEFYRVRYSGALRQLQDAVFSQVYDDYFGQSSWNHQLHKIGLVVRAASLISQIYARLCQSHWLFRDFHKD